MSRPLLPLLKPLSFSICSPDDCRLAGIGYNAGRTCLDVLEMAVWSHGDRLRHHSGRGVQYTSIQYTERLIDIRAVRSVGWKSNSYDNAVTESLNGIYEKDLIDLEGPWRGVDDVILATLEPVSLTIRNGFTRHVVMCRRKNMKKNHYACHEGMVN